MCGIIAAINKKKIVNEKVLEQFEDQSTRGTNGFGVITINDDKKIDVKRATGQIKAIIDIKLSPSKMIMFHHRSPSSSKNKISQTHPISIKSKDFKYDYLFMHNGIIHNEKELKKKHEKEGYRYSTKTKGDTWYGKTEEMFNDSECLGYEIAEFIEGKTEKVEATGSAAFFMLQLTKGKKKRALKMYFGRNNNPLKIEKDDNHVFMSSEGNGDDVKADILFTLNLDTLKIASRKMVIAGYTPTPVATPAYESYSNVPLNGIYSRPHGHYPSTVDLRRSKRNPIYEYEEQEWEKDLREAEKAKQKQNDAFDDVADANAEIANARSGFRDDKYDDKEYLTIDETVVVEDYEEKCTDILNDFFEMLKTPIGTEELYLIDPMEPAGALAQIFTRATEFCRRAMLTERISKEDDDTLTEGEQIAEVDEKDRALITDYNHDDDDDLGAGGTEWKDKVDDLEKERVQLINFPCKTCAK